MKLGVRAFVTQAGSADLTSLGDNIRTRLIQKFSSKVKVRTLGPTPHQITGISREFFTIGKAS